MFYGMDPARVGEFDAAIQKLWQIFPRHFSADMLITFSRNMGFLEDPEFLKAVELEARTDQDRSLVWRLHTLCWAAANALKLKGDFVECGVFHGFSTAVAAKYLDFGKQARTWYLYDTFSGIPTDQLDPGHVNPPSYVEPSIYDGVKRRFEGYPNIRVVRGRVPEVFSEAVPQSIAFMHLDMNSAAAEMGALEVLFERMVPGGFLVLDDYGWYVYRAQKLAEDPFFRRHGCPVLELPTGQGLVIKSG
jgi:O-methyltransferase